MDACSCGDHRGTIMPYQVLQHFYNLLLDEKTEMNPNGKMLVKVTSVLFSADYDEHLPRASLLWCMEEKQIPSALITTATCVFSCDGVLACTDILAPIYVRLCVPPLACLLLQCTCITTSMQWTPPCMHECAANLLANKGCGHGVPFFAGTTN